MKRTYPLDEVAANGIGPSARWLREQIRQKRITGHKIGREVRMCDECIDTALEVWEIGRDAEPVVEAAPVHEFKLTPAAARRRSA